jgi:hypothetical protein
MRIYAIQFNHGEKSYKGSVWEMLGWKYIYATRESAEKALADRKRIRECDYRVTEMEVNE